MFLSILISSLLVLLPFALWGYLVSYIRSDTLSYQSYAMGSIIGIAVLVSIIFLGSIAAESPLYEWHLLSTVERSSDLSKGIMSGLITPLIVLVICALFSGIYLGAKKVLSDRKSHTLMASILVVWATIGAIWSSGVVDKNLSGEALKVAIWTFTGTLSITGYYLVVALLEEGGKVLWSLQISRKLEDLVMLWAFSALWFSTVENLLYMIRIGLWDGYMSTYALRSIFSTSLHIGATVLALRLIAWRGESLWIIPWAFVVSVGCHALFDIGLSHGSSIVLIGSLVVAYIALTKPLEDERTVS